VVPPRETVKSRIEVYGTVDAKGPALGFNIRSAVGADARTHVGHSMTAVWANKGLIVSATSIFFPLRKEPFSVHLHAPGDRRVSICLQGPNQGRRNGILEAVT